MQSVDWTIDGLPEETQKLLRTYVKDVTKVYGSELEGIILYGSAVRGEFLPR
jgi:predicted nucleotidyltransferase